MNKKKIILAAGVVLVLAVAGFWIFGKKNAQGKVDFVTEKSYTRKYQQFHYSYRNH